MSSDGQRFSAGVMLWHHCNLKCPYCFAAPTPPPRKWSDEVAGKIALLRKFLARTGRWTVSLSGGEPTIYPGFSQLCQELAADGHRVEFISNGILPFHQVFDGPGVAAVSKVVMSYHTAHEQSGRHRDVFVDNLRYLADHGVSVSLNYVVYPGRREDLQAVKARFAELGAVVKFLPFQGELDGKSYPRQYDPQDRRAIRANGDITARYLMEHGHYTPTFQPCRAGHEKFYIWLRTGEVYTCEQLTGQPLADLTVPTAAQDFLARRSRRPIICPAKRCVCRHTVAQEKFLASNDREDQQNYAGWERVSRPSDRALDHWRRQEQEFADGLLAGRAGDEVFIWGGGGHTVQLLDLLGRTGRERHLFRGIIDGNPRLDGHSLLGLPILSPDRFSRENPRCTDILISSRAFEQEIAGEIAGRFGERYNVLRIYAPAARTADLLVL